MFQKIIGTNLSHETLRREVTGTCLQYEIMLTKVAGTKSTV